MYVKTDRKEVEYGCTGYRVAVRGMCMSGQTKKGWIRGVQVNGTAERCVYVRTEMKGWIRDVQFIG